MYSSREQQSDNGGNPEAAQEPRYAGVQYCCLIVRQLDNIQQVRSARMPKTVSRCRMWVYLAGGLECDSVLYNTLYGQQDVLIVE
jgi:hypothetical protein